MRIVSGTARGRKLLTPEGIDIRPTTDKVKEAMFSIIQFDLQNKAVLDLFAGTGQLGLEAISRGAKSVCFVDSSKKALELVKKNIALTGFSKSARVSYGDSFSFLKSCNEKFDIIILDPPYENGMCEKAAALLPDVLRNNAIVICETRPDEKLPENIGKLKIAKEYKYSAIKLTVYREMEE
ncbi:MAG: 16S rRNA (guanine(966)-N(2))-methyltransferase RsmD [Oscillospiraceae bacterium]|nr:16S rRNA (guanine(966)-N(2))-methyltransferase RsmD [Oscillospiraceae bacterium]